MKNEKHRKNPKTKIKFFTFIFCIWKWIYFTVKHSLGKCSLYYYISSKAFFSVAGYLKRGNETPTSIQIWIGLVDVANADVKEIFCLSRNWIHLLRSYFLSSVYLKQIYKTLKGIGKT